MFPFPIAKPQGCDIQTFYGTNSANKLQKFSWNKPVGVSHVYMLLIGAGGTGNGTSGGGSGSVTTWYGAAQHVPNNLIVEPGIGDATANTTIFFASRSTNLITLIDTLSATGATGGPATIPEAFAASGFFNSVAGQDGSSSANSASTTTFLSGAGTGATSTSNYGYVNKQAATNYTHGYFLMQPIIVGVAGINDGDGGIGCGGAAASAKGGPGMVLIASW
jgi:hypothetical protein